MNPFIIIGKITKPHGIKGEVSVDFYADSPSILGQTVWLKLPPAPPYTCEVLVTRRHQGRLLLTLENVPDRTAAELLRNAEVLIPRDRLPALEPGEIYLADLPGFTVILKETNEPIGEIVEIDLSSGQEIWRIATPTGKEVLFPAVPEFVAELNAETRTAHITPPSGLLEIYL
jgi:16S rRNA processing protein RimM